MGAVRVRRRTQVVIEEVEEHQHAAAHDHKDADHDGGDVHRLLVLLLGAVVPLVLHVASACEENNREDRFHLKTQPPSWSAQTPQSSFMPLSRLAGSHSPKSCFRDTPLIRSVLGPRPSESQSPMTDSLTH